MYIQCIYRGCIYRGKYMYYVVNHSSPPRFSRTGREAGTNYGAGVDMVFAYKICTKNEHGGEEDGRLSEI